MGGQTGEGMKRMTWRIQIGSYSRDLDPDPRPLPQDAGGLRAELQEAILVAADRLGRDWDEDALGRQQEGGRPARPSAVVPCSAQTGEEDWMWMWMDRAPMCRELPCVNTR